MPQPLTGTRILYTPLPAAHFGAGTIGALPGIVRGTGGQAVALVTDAALAGTPVVATAKAALTADGLAAAVFTGVHPNPTTEDVAAGAGEVAALTTGGTAVTVVAVGGGSVIDAAKGIALAAVNPQRGRALDYRGTFARAALPLVAVPTTAGTGAETNAFGVVTDVQAGRKFYVGHASTLPAAAILDPDLTLGLPPAGTAATGMDALTHALESYLSRRANPWADGVALQVMRMVAAHLPRAVADGADREARAQMLLAAHLAGAAMASTGLGVCHAIGHSLGSRFGVAHGAALSVVLPQVLRFNLAICRDRLADVAFALGEGDTARDQAGNAAAAIDAVTVLRDSVGLTRTLAAFGIGAADYAQIGADVLDDEVLANTPRMPDAADIAAILTAAQSLAVLTCQVSAPGAARRRKRRALPPRHRALARSVASARPSHFPAEGGSHAAPHAREFRRGQDGPDRRQRRSGRGLNSDAGGGRRACRGPASPLQRGHRPEVHRQRRDRAVPHGRLGGREQCTRAALDRHRVDTGHDPRPACRRLPGCGAGPVRLGCLGGRRGGGQPAVRAFEATDCPLGRHRLDPGSQSRPDVPLHHAEFPEHGLRHRRVGRRVGLPRAHQHHDRPGDALERHQLAADGCHPGVHLQRGKEFLPLGCHGRGV
jgi:alcohol dehydrogenase